MVVYLPIAFIKDCFYKLYKKQSSKTGRGGDEFSVRITSPRKSNGGQRNTEVEMGSMARKDSDADLSMNEESMPLVTKYNDPNASKANKQLTTREIAIYGFYIAPIWFLTEVV